MWGEEENKEQKRSFDEVARDHGDGEIPFGEFCLRTEEEKREEEEVKERVEEQNDDDRSS